MKMEREDKNITIGVGIYAWTGRQPIPKCDSCSFNDATHKIFATGWDYKYRKTLSEIGIRLCEECLAVLKSKLYKIKTLDM